MQRGGEVDFGWGVLPFNLEIRSESLWFSARNSVHGLCPESPTTIWGFQGEDLGFGG